MSDERLPCSKCGHDAETWRLDGSVILICHRCQRIDGRGEKAKEALRAFAAKIPGANLMEVRWRPQ